jgi:subtilisin family serine protease
MDAWEITQGSSNVVVAILAGGLYPFAEFEGRLVPGYNFVINNTNTTAIGSGDDMAAVIGANANNALGGAGVDWRCRLMPVTVLNDAGLCWASWLAQGIDFAVSNGCKVIHCSGVNEPYGAPWDSMSLQLAVSNAIAQGVIVVAPTGGHNSSRIIPPASYPGVIAVGGIVMSGGRFSSNFGPKIDLVAPAEGIVIWVASPSSPNGYYLRSFGNSYAVAMVSGVCSLLAALRPEITPEQVRQLLCLGALDQVGDKTDTPGFDIYYGWGLLNAYNSLLLAQTRIDQVRFITNIIPCCCTNRILELSWKSPANASNKQPYEIEFTTSLTNGWTKVESPQFRYEAERTYWSDPCCGLSALGNQTRFYRLRLKQLPPKN